MHGGLYVHWSSHRRIARYSSIIAIFAYPTCTRCSRWGSPRRNIAMTFGEEKLQWCGYPMVKKFRRHNDLFIPFNRVHSMNVTDGQTDIAWRHAQTALMHSIARQKMTPDHFFCVPFSNTLENKNIWLLTLLLYTYLPAGLREAQPCRFCFYSIVQKWVFRPTGRHVAPINVKFGMGSALKVRYPMPNFTLSGQKCGNTAPELSKFRILAINLPLRGDSFAQFLRNSQHLYASI